MSDTYIIFGEAKIEDLSAQAQQTAAEQFRTPDVTKSEATKEDADKLEKTEEVVEEEDVDETDVDARDIELVMQQAGVTRSKAVTALKNNDGDIVNAIMDLTM